MATRNRMPEEVDYRKPAQPTSHDFLADKKWVVFVPGYSETRNPIYNIYRGCLISTLIYMTVMGVAACCLRPEKQLIITAAHSILLNIFGMWTLLTRLLTQRSIDKTRSMIWSGVYCYEDEEEDEKLMKMKTGIPKEVYAKCLISIYILGAITNGVLFPLSQIILVDPDSSEDARVVNPYFPLLFYQPLDMRIHFGILYGFLFGSFYFSIIYSAAIGTNWMYVSYAVQMRVHLQILNYSIKNIQKRASLIYSKNFGRHFHDLPKANELLQTQEFEWCLYKCLRSNIQHHQALLRFMKSFRPFYGSYILIFFSLASSVFGTLLYLMNQAPPINIMILLVVSFIAEQFSVIYVCVLGEDVITESQKVFRRLYRISWFNYNKRFNQILQTMMANTLNPMGLKALLLGVPASLEVYGSIISAMYKICSLVRQSDVV